MRTKYFTELDDRMIWRYKNNKMTYFSLNTFVPSCRKIDGSSYEFLSRSWRQISRDEARKIMPDAFR